MTEYPLPPPFPGATVSEAVVVAAPMFANGWEITTPTVGRSTSNYVTWVVRAPYVLYGVKYIDLVSLGKKGERC